MMIATSFPAICPSNGPKRSRRLYGWLFESQGCEDRAVFTVGDDLRLKTKPIDVHFSGIGAVAGEGIFPSLSFANYMSERSFGFTALQYGVGGSLSCAGLTPSSSRTVAPRFWRPRSAASCARAFTAPPCRRFAPRPA